MISIDHTINSNGATYLTPEYVRFLFDNNLVVDASAGGLIAGPSWNEGAIALVGCNRQADFFVAGYVFGGCYLVNAFAASEHADQIDAFAQDNGAAVAPYPLPEGVTVLQVTPKEIGGELHTPVLFFSTNVIRPVSPAQAKQHVSFLEQINRQACQTHVIETNAGGGAEHKISGFSILNKYSLPTSGDN